MEEKLRQLREASLQAIREANALDALDAVRVKYLGKKGELTAMLKQMGGLSAEERPKMGQLANSIREELTQALEDGRKALADKALQMRLAAEREDVTIPGTPVAIGREHPLTRVINEFSEIAIGMGFTIAEGPEVELASYNFDKLNTAPGHPARDRQDTFYFTDDDSVLLRTQTSPVQIHVMETYPLPIRIIAPGRVYRKDEVDATHSPMFHQIEGLVVDEGVTFGDLKGTLNELVHRLYGNDLRTRFRPHHFPFTEPSCEMDVECFKCHGAGCPVCKGEGWVELLGGGMVHPKVLAGCGIDTDKYSGFAFGFGSDRLAMFRYNISDLRLLFENDVRFLEQF